MMDFKTLAKPKITKLQNHTYGLLFHNVFVQYFSNFEVLQYLWLN
jgi:hypothetical protein